MRPRLVRSAGLAIVVAFVLLAGCVGDEASAPESLFADGGAAAVDVDTAELRAQREAAGIAACPGPPRVGGSDQVVDGGLPEVALPCLGGGPVVDLATLRGPLVVNLWAQWCVPCGEELPYFARLHDEGVAVLGVDFQDTQPGAALALAEQAGVTYPSVADVDGVLGAPLRVPGLPTTVLVDGAGRVAAVLPRRFASYDELADAVDDHLGVRP